MLHFRKPFLQCPPLGRRQAAATAESTHVEAVRGSLELMAKTMIALVLRFAQDPLLAAPDIRENQLRLCPPLAPTGVCAGFGVWRVGARTRRMAQK